MNDPMSTTTRYRWRVTCDELPRAQANAGWGHCTFNGYRVAETADEAGQAPCPRCGGLVQVTPNPLKLAP